MFWNKHLHSSGGELSQKKLKSYQLELYLQTVKQDKFFSLLPDSYTSIAINTRLHPILNKSKVRCTSGR